MTNSMLPETSPSHLPAQHRPAPFALTSLTVALLTVLAELANVVAGLTGTPRGTVGALLMAATLPAALGIALAVTSLMRHEESHNLGHAALWLNGAVAVFAAPLAMAWTLGMK